MFKSSASKNKRFVSENYKSILRDILKIALPISIQTMLISSLQLVDNLFIGRLENATYVASAVNAVNNVSFIIFSLIASFISSVGIYLIKFVAEKKVDKQKDIFRIKLFYMLVLSIVFIIPSSIFIKEISQPWIAGNDAKASQFSREYGNIIIPSLVIGLTTLIFSNTFKESKIIKITIIISLIAFGINSILNYVFMYVLDMGVKGAAIATIISRAIELTIWIMYILYTKPKFIPRIKTWLNIDYHIAFKMFPKCFLWTINGFLLSLGFTIRIMFISRYSLESGVSLNSAGAFIQIFRSILVGYSQGLPILIIGFIARHVKKQDGREKIKDYLLKMTFISFVVGLIVGVLGSSFSPLLFVLYPNYSYDINMQSLIMIISISIFMPIGIMNDVPISALKGMGISKSLVIGDSIFDWFLIFPILMALIYSNNSISYGWIYAITVGIGALKPIFLFTKTFKILGNKEKDILLKI